MNSVFTSQRDSPCEIKFSDRSPCRAHGISSVWDEANNPEPGHLFESHLSHLICIGQWTLCSRPKGILDVKLYSALATLDRPMELARSSMRRKDSEAKHFFGGHLGDFICIGWWTLCSRPKGILDVKLYSALATLDRLMEWAHSEMRRRDPEAEHFFESHLGHFICIGQ